MNIHEHQAKDILKEFGAPVSKGIVIFNKSEIEEKISKLSENRYVLKAQIHAGGRGKAGGVKLLENKKALIIESKKMTSISIIRILIQQVEMQFHGMEW